MKNSWFNLPFRVWTLEAKVTTLENIVIDLQDQIDTLSGGDPEA